MSDNELRLRNIGGKGWELTPEVERIDHEDGSFTVYMSHSGPASGVRVWWSGRAPISPPSH